MHRARVNGGGARGRSRPPPGGGDHGRLRAPGGQAGGQERIQQKQRQVIMVRPV